MIKAIKWIDRYLGIPACLLFGILRKPFPKRKSAIPRNILVVQLWGIGETILTLPAIKELQRKFPKSRISVLCTARNRDVYKGQGVNILTLRLNLFAIKWFVLKNIRRYDLVIDMEEYLNISALITFFVGRRKIGFDHGIRAMLYDTKVTYKDMQHCSRTFMDLLHPLGIQKKIMALEKLRTTADEDNKSSRLLASLGVSRKDILIACSPGAAESAHMRMWPEERWAALIDKLQQERMVKVLLVGALDADALNGRIRDKVKNKERVFNVAAKTALGEFFALMKRIDLMISIDSGPMHIAAAQQVPTIGLFGPNTPKRFAPLGKDCVSIYKTNYPPIINVHKGEVPDKSDIDFMAGIRVDDVYKAASAMLGKRINKA